MGSGETASVSGAQNLRSEGWGIFGEESVRQVPKRLFCQVTACISGRHLLGCFVHLFVTAFDKCWRWHYGAQVSQDSDSYYVRRGPWVLLVLAGIRSGFVASFVV